ncbi:MAG: K+/H+ antiporter subunit F [Bradymonadaceae bacterium]
MILYAVYTAFGLLGGALLLNLWRLLVGPRDLERILALDTLYVNTIAIFVTVGITFGTELYFEAGLLIAMMGFLGTVALCKYYLRGDIIE